MHTSVTLLLSFSIGRWVDNAPSRLRTLLITISVNRATVILACAIWVFIVEAPHSEDHHNISKLTSYTKEPVLGLRGRFILFGIAITLGTLERLSSIANLISMERDWLVILGNFASTGQAGLQGYNLTRLNAVMRRIDLVCKLIGPLVISFIIAGTSMHTGVFVVAGMSASTWSIEIWSAWSVWRSCHVLQQPKTATCHNDPAVLVHNQHSRSFCIRTREMAKAHMSQLQAYFGSSVWIPSLALSLLHVSVLTYNATLITWLLASGFSLVLITVVRAVGSVVEISSTFVAPYSITYLAKTSDRKKATTLMTEDGAEEALLERAHPGADAESDRQHLMLQMKHGTGLERCGLWGISLQTLCLVCLSSSCLCVRRASSSHTLVNSFSRTS